MDPAPDELLKEVKKAMKPKDPAKVKTRFQEILDRAGANPRDDNVASRCKIFTHWTRFIITYKMLNVFIFRP